MINVGDNGKIADVLHHLKPEKPVIRGFKARKCTGFFRFPESLYVRSVSFGILVILVGYLQRQEHRTRTTLYQHGY